MTVLIAPLALADAPALALLQNRLWRETYSGLLPDEVLAARDDASNTARWLERARAHEAAGRSAEGARTVVAHDEVGVPIGWASTGPPRDADPPTDVELWSLYVASEHHGLGVAQELMEVVCPSALAVHVWVLDGNDRAIGFYRKVGFESDGRTKRDPRLGVHELRMVRARRA